MPPATVAVIFRERADRASRDRRNIGESSMLFVTIAVLLSYFIKHQNKYKKYFRYNAFTEQCESFDYGCDGNANRSRSAGVQNIFLFGNFLKISSQVFLLLKKTSNFYWKSLCAPVLGFDTLADCKLICTGVKWQKTNSGTQVEKVGLLRMDDSVTAQSIFVSSNSTGEKKFVLHDPPFATWSHCLGTQDVNRDGNVTAATSIDASGGTNLGGNIQFV
jgi:hypothetical protein